MAYHRNITIIGGSGFLGRYVVRHLARAGARIRIVCRNPNAALHLKTAGDPGQVVLAYGHLAKPETLETAIAGADAVVNLAGILFESGRQRFAAVQANGPEILGKLAKKHGCARVVHVSALGIDSAFDSDYARTKLMGEKALLAAFPAATILRPSILFGAEDRFFNQFAAMPILPLIGGGKTRFQPVYVDDAAKAVAACLENLETAGRTYELGGATIYSFRALMEFINHTLRTRKPMVNIPFGIASALGLASETLYALLPVLRAPMITRDQVRLLKHDNVVREGSASLADLGITPQPLEMIVPRYLSRFNPRKGG